MSGLDITVVELAEGISGPLAALRLSELGARVVKIEPPEGDYMRAADPAMPGSTDSCVFHELNRGKRAIALGEESSAAVEALHALLAQADVLIHDRSEDECERLGLDRLAAEGHPENPGLVIVDISDWGRAGPHAGRAGSELTGQAAAGYTRYLGQLDLPARRLGADVGSIACAYFAIQAALAALLVRRRDGGRGQRVRVSRYNALLSMKSIHLAAQADPDQYAGPRVGGPYDPIEAGWKTGDRPIFFSFGGSVGATGRAGWVDFVKEMGMDEMLDDARFDQRGKNSSGHGSDAIRLRPEYERHFAAHKAEDVVAAMHRHRANASVYVGFPETLEHPQTIAMGLVRTGRDGERRVKPTIFDRGHDAVGALCPPFGADTRTVLAEVGLDAAEIDALLRADAFRAAG